MNKKIYLIILLLTCGICNAQNLVPNGDFESFSTCPTSVGQIYSTNSWMTPTTNIFITSGTPDYYNQCANAGSFVDVPNNWGGYQQAHSGVAYSGITLREITDFREYIEVPFTSPLNAGSCYHFEMYVNLVDTCNKTTDAIGVYFSNTAVTGVNNYLPLPFVPQLNNMSGFITDTLNWTLISGDYTATGGESHLIIGNFKDDNNSTFVLVNPVGKNITYFYIDDVSLSPCTGINQLNENSVINTYPNPFSKQINITINNDELSEIILYDIASRKLLQEKFTNSVSLNTEQFTKGLYLYEVWSKNGLCKKGKVVKN